MSTVKSTTLFERYLTKKKKSGEKMKVYLNAIQTTNTKTNNLMLSGKIEDVDSTSLLLENQECLIPFTSILSIKPDRD